MKNNWLVWFWLFSVWVLGLGVSLRVDALKDRVTALEQQKSTIIEHERAHLGEKDKK